MTLHYASALHHEDDPGGLIGEAFAMGPDFPGPAEDLLLSWMMRLPVEMDASSAARRLLARYAGNAEPLPEDHRGRLVELLRQAADATPGSRKGRRRGRPGPIGQAIGSKS